MSYSNYDKRLIIKQIENIKNRAFYMQILQILHDAPYKYTVNKNGIFFNLLDIPNTTLSKIDVLIREYQIKKS